MRSPQPTKWAPPPPPPPRITVSPLVSRLSLTAAVFVFGGYPQREWKEAVAELKRRILTETPYSDICPTSIWLLGRKDFGKNYKYI